MNPNLQTMQGTKMIKWKNDSTLCVTGVIGDIPEYGFTSDEFVAQLETFDPSKTLILEIDSPGGYVNQSMKIYNAIMDHPGRVEGVINVEAASGAAIFSQACDKLSIYANGSFMIHKAWTVAMGNSDDFKEMAEALDVLDGQQIEIFAERSGNTEEKIDAWMAAETTFSADDAVAHGFVDEVIRRTKGPRGAKRKPVEPVAKCDRAAFAKIAKAKAISFRHAANTAKRRK